MKRLFFFVSLCCAVITGRAQTSDALMATLQSGDRLTVFYGKGAFQEAYEAAADSGDVIMLSAGAFSSPNEVQKSLTIIGSGCADDPDNGRYSTIIQGAIRFNQKAVTDADGNPTGDTISYDGTRLEGIRADYVAIEGGHTVNNITISKCEFPGTMSASSIVLNNDTRNFTIRQCVLRRGASFENYSRHANFYVVGSYIQSFGTSSNASITIDNSIINGRFEAGVVSNSIFSDAANGVVANNCIFMGSAPEVVGGGNWFNCTYEDVFAESMTNLDWDGEKTFRLKSPDMYVGTDGTEVGLYGGPYPYNPTPSTPQIREMNIDSTVAGEGKLKVSVTVEAQTEN